MVRELSKPQSGKILYSPAAGADEREGGEWQRLFEPMGFGVYSFLAKRELDPAKARSAHIIISTPEKWDSSSRKFRHDTQVRKRRLGYYHR